MKIFFTNIFFAGVLNASDHFRMEFFTNLKEESIANMISTYCLHHAAENAVNCKLFIVNIHHSHIISILLSLHVTKN